MKTKISLLTLVIFSFAIVIVSCKKEMPNLVSDEAYSSSPVLPEIPYNYVASTNDHAASLGRVLFYDKALSLNNSVACASCHQQSKAFCDNLQFSTGLEDHKTSRNSPSIFAKSGRVFWDGRASSLEDLALRPVKNHVEMRFENLEALSGKISRINYYPSLFKKAFGTSEIDSVRIQQALAEFLRNFNFSNNKFARSRKKIENLTASEQIGQNLFFGKAQCSKCHHIEGDNQVIIDPFDSTGTGGGGGYGSTDPVPFAAPGLNIGLDMVYADNGSGEITRNPEDNGKFMLPVLLNVEYTAPYMHDGRFKTLEEVIEHYNSGIKNHPNLDFRLRDLKGMENMTEQQIINKLDVNRNGIVDGSEAAAFGPRKLGLTESEKRNLVDFLKTLSDPSILREIKFSNPFIAKQ